MPNITALEGSYLARRTHIEAELCRQIGTMALGAEVAKAAIDEIGHIYGYAEYKLITACKAAQLLRPDTAGSCMPQPSPEETHRAGAVRACASQIARLAELVGERLISLVDTRAH
jgi:hypothetical protein